MSLLSTRALVLLTFLLHNFSAFSQDPDCPTPTFFKTIGAENQSEYATAITSSSDGNLFLAGRKGNRTFLQKTNLQGEVIWLRDFQLSPFEPIAPSQIFEDSEGMIVGCGTQNQFAGARRGFVFRYDPVANAFLWAHPMVSNNPTAGGILEKEPGGSFVYYQNPVFSDGETDMEITDLERATGNIIAAFASRYEHLSFDALSKMVIVNGSLYGAGWAAGRQGTTTDARRMLLARFDPVNGMPVWAQMSHVDTSVQADYFGRDLIVDGDVLVSAYVGNGDSGNPDIYELFLQKTDLDGNILWVRRYDFKAGILKLLTVPDGYVVYGQQNGNEHYVLKTNKNGIPIWGRKLVQGPASPIESNLFTPQQAVAVADSLYFTGISTTGLSDVFFWKMLADGTMADSCGFVQNIDIQSFEVLNPVQTLVDLQQLISPAVSLSATANWATSTMEEKLLCPDCTVPDPCPEDNDFIVELNSIQCSAGLVNLTFSICDLDGGTIPPLSITFYDANPYLGAADKLETYNYNSSNPDSCVTVQLVNLANAFGQNVLQNGVQIFAVVNDEGNTVTPFDPADFPLSSLEECDYLNNIDSIVVQLPGSPTLNIGPDQTICANESALLDAGPGFYRYQWSNGVTTQTNSISFGGTYRITVTDPCGFQQTDTINIQVKPLPFIQENGEFCPGKSVTIRGFTFNQAGTYQKIIPGANTDCDTSATFFISQLPYEERIEVINFCPFETVTINGMTYEDSGLVRDTVPSSTTCDTIVFYFLNQLPLPFRNFHFDLCPGDSVQFNGQVYYQPIDFTDTLFSTGFGCDTIAYVSIDVLPQASVSRTVQFCPGTSLVIAGQFYTVPGTYLINLPDTAGGCDTLATYTLEWLPAPAKEEIVQFCQGSSVTIGGQTYTQPGTVLQTIPGSGGGCDTLLTYILQWLPAPTRTETLEFCAGESFIFNGQTYTQPAVVTLLLPGAGNACDTLVTYQIQYLNPPASTLTLSCPNSTIVATNPGTGSVPVTYSLPTLTSDCVCPGNALVLTNGLPSGSLFPVGNTQVCYTAKDSCGSEKSCCFIVSVREELPCDTKTTGCIQYDLLSITANAKQERTYRIRVTNNCSSKLIYTAIQLPNGVTAVSPANLSTYTSPDGRNYAVRNPNYSPFYSIRFKTTTDSISNGASDVFEYTLPAQTLPTYINITSRLQTQSFYAAHLNTFNCPIGTTPSASRWELSETEAIRQSGILLFPNPTSGELFADLSRWQGADLNLQILDSRGARVQSLSMQGSSEAQAIPLASQLPSGLYFLEIVTASGEKEVARFVLER